MASKHFVTIKLDPHYQRFLRTQFGCEEEIFEFPARHKFNSMLEHFVVTRPPGFIEPEKDEYMFKIALPNFEYKNEAHFRYLSKVKEIVFKSKIKQYYDWIIEEKIMDLMKNLGSTPDNDSISLNRNECTLVLIDEFGFDSGDKDSFDRLYKLFTRYKKKERIRRFRNAKKGLKVKS